MRVVAVFVGVMLLSGAACGSSLHGARTSGLTSVTSESSGNVFTWTVVNNTGPGDGQPGWDVLIWSIEPFGFPDPVRVIAPPGWEWNDRGFGRFEIQWPCSKYSSPPAIPPGGSLVFTYEIGSPSASEPGFLAHVGAVLPEPTQVGGVTHWTPTTVAGHSSWFDRSSQGSASPEPSAILALLVWCSATAALVKRVRR